MEGFIILAALAAIFYWVFTNYSKRTKLISDDEKFSQYFITVNYKDGTATFKNHTFPVKDITGISTVTREAGRGVECFVEVSVDDIRKPIHRIGIPSGFGSAANKASEFSQRLCVAVRKAGGRSFI